MNFGIVVAAFVILILILLVCREITCWYFKINKMLVIFEKMENSLAALSGVLPKPELTTEPTKIEPEITKPEKSIGGAIGRSMGKAVGNILKHRKKEF